MAIAIETRVAASITPTDESRRLEHLDALRGIAAISVVAHHYVLAFGLPGGEWVMTRTPLHILWDGPAAVSFFFVLSGLVLSFRHFRTTPRPDLEGFSFGRYAVARGCRIWLPYLFVLFLSVLVLRCSAQHVSTIPPRTPWIGEFWTQGLSFKSLLRQAIDIRIVSADAGSRLLVPQAWSLTVEIVLSHLVPFGILVLGRSTLWFLGSVVIAIAFAGLSPFAGHFALGMILAKHYRAVIGWLEPRVATRCLLSILGAVLYTYSNYKYKSMRMDLMQFDYASQAIGSMILIAVTSASRYVRNWLSRGLAAYIGRISYSIYLIHMCILLCLTPRVLSKPSGLAPAISWLIGLAFTVVVSVAVSVPLYWYIEVPSIALGQRLNRKLSKTP